MTRAQIDKAFRRNRDGSWTCIAAVCILHPRGPMEVVPGTRLVRNTMFMGVDLATWLDEQTKRD